jgi:hypothetical protein
LGADAEYSFDAGVDVVLHHPVRRALNRERPPFFDTKTRLSI